ncbi:MAG: DsrE family protein [Acetobacteraceae bacterium]
MPRFTTIIHLGFAGLLGWAMAAGVAAGPAAAQDADLRIDVPVVLKEARVVFNLDHLAFDGDEPIGLNFLHIMTERFRADGTAAKIVAVFHGPNGYMLLNDAAYDRVRHWQHGNPYKDQIAALMRAGVEVEECGQTMRANGWRNADLLPGIKVNSGANFRIVELVQQGYVQLQP